MGLFSRSAKSEPQAPPPEEYVADGSDESDLVIPKFKGLDYESSRALREGVEGLAALGVDIDDLSAVGAAFDLAYTRWQAAKSKDREDHDVIVERFAIAIGEHLERTTDLEWGMVSDAFGTDIGLGARDDDFMIVPSNLVAVRWLNGETGWVPGVVAHLKRVRASA